MAKCVVFIGPSGSGTADHAARYASKLKPLLSINNRELEKVVHHGGNPRLGTIGFSATEKRQHNQIPRLEHALKRAMFAKKALVIADIPLFFVNQSLAFEHYIENVRLSSVDLVATATSTNDIPLGLFDQVFLGQSFNPSDLYHHERNKLSAGSFLRLRLERHSSTAY